MSAADNREPGAARLLTDILAGGQPERELLIRYARTPASLSDAERAEVERLLAENPRYADRLRVLQGFSAAAATQSFEQPAVARRRATPRRIRRLLLTAMPAAAAIVFAFVYSMRELPSRPGIIVAQTNDETTPRPVPAPAPAPAVPSDPAVEPPASPDPMLSAPSAPAAEPEPAPAPVVVEKTTPPAPRAEPAPEPVQPSPAPTVAEADTKPEPQAAPEEPEVLVAMGDLDYVAPGGNVERPRVSSALRGGALRTSLTAVVPEHIGLTNWAQPTLFWHVDVLPDPALPFTFTITDESSLQTLKTVELPRPERPGLQRIDLRDLGVVLTPSTEYRWSVFLRPDPRQRSLDRLAQGWVTYVPPAAQPLVVRRVGNARLAADMPDAIAEAAREGLWYDALEGIMDVLDSQPENASAQRALRKLLEQAGLASIAP